MTPAVKVLERDGADFELRDYEHDPRAPAYGEEAARALGLDPDSVFKTLVARLDDGRLAVGIVPVSGQLDLKALARSEEHTSELQSRPHLVCRLLLEKKKAATAGTCGRSGPCSSVLPASLPRRGLCRRGGRKVRCTSPVYRSGRAGRRGAVVASGAVW